MLEKIFTLLKDSEKVVFMGVGEEKLTDDGVGPYIISELLEYDSERFLFINAGVDPMARINEIIELKPTRLVLIDTCTYNGPPGTIALLEREHLAEYVPISSHTIPLHVVIDFLIEKLPESSLSVFMIGIVPESLEGFTELTQYKEGELTLDELNENENLPFFSIRLTNTIKKVADDLIATIREIIQRL